LIWGSSFVLVKMVLPYTGPLTVAGLRYFLAFLILLPFLKSSWAAARPLSKRLWGMLLLIGLSAYTIGNGALFWGLEYVPATTASFLMSFTPVIVLLGGVLWLREIPSPAQIVGMLAALLGSVLFFASGLQAGEALGIAIVFVGMVSFALSGIFGRGAARDGRIDTLSLTAIPLALGGGILALLALALEGIPRLPPQAWGIVLWLAAANTALAYLVYYHALRWLTALEMNMLMRLSPLGTALIAWALLGERLSAIQMAGMVLTVVGVGIVQQPRVQSLQSRTQNHPENLIK
jgi:probable blue pigment (indigoidine) exporter